MSEGRERKFKARHFHLDQGQDEVRTMPDLLEEEILFITRVIEASRSHARSDSTLPTTVQVTLGTDFGDLQISVPQLDRAGAEGVVRDLRTEFPEVEFRNVYLSGFKFHVRIPRDDALDENADGYPPGYLNE